MEIRKATKKQLKLRLALDGMTGSGKTYTALAIADGLGKKIGLIDTEHRRASLYADEFSFDVIELDTFSPLKYVEAIHEFENAGYDVIIADSISHAWMGKDGALQQVDNAAKRSQSGNSYVAWREVTPIHNEFVETMIRCKAHLIVTMRSKMEYVLETNEKGKTVPRKVGLAPIQREGIEYEFDVVGDLNGEHEMIISKTRCKALDGKIFAKAGKDVAKLLLEWLDSGENPQDEINRISATIKTKALDAIKRASILNSLEPIEKRIRERFESGELIQLDFDEVWGELDAKRKILTLQKVETHASQASA